MVSNQVPEQQPDHRGGPHHVVSVFAKSFSFFFFFTSAWCRWTGTKAVEQQRCDWSAFAAARPSFLRGGGGGGGETECRAAGYQQQRELKQRFLINPENVESKSSAHVVKISQGWAATGMIASPNKDAASCCRTQEPEGPLFPSKLRRKLNMIDCSGPE